MKLTIAIPVYEPRREDLLQCLDSIFSQNADPHDFEVICVDDCSPTSTAHDIIKSYTYAGRHPANLIYLRHSENKRQGGARNTAIATAIGEYFTCIDQDDFYMPGALQAMLYSMADNPDMVMFDFAVSKEKGKINVERHYSDQPTSAMSGKAFLKNHEITWMPWEYIYKTQYINGLNMRFVENVRFEDRDFILECIARATKIKYDPTVIICYNLHDSQTTVMGNDIARNTDLIKMAFRLGVVAETLAKEGNPAYEQVLAHSDFSYNVIWKKHAWRLPYRVCRDVIRDYPPSKLSKYHVLQFMRRHPTLSACGFTAVSPLMRTIYFLYTHILTAKG